MRKVFRRYACLANSPYLIKVNINFRVLLSYQFVVEAQPHFDHLLLPYFRPKYLLLHLKRFIFVERPITPNEENCPPNNGKPAVEFVFQKNKVPVTIPRSLALEPFCIQEHQFRAPKAQYSLKSIVHHHGNRASSGHYTADAVRSINDSVDPPPTTTGQGSADTEQPPVSHMWVTFDDTNSCVTSLEKILGSRNKQSAAYLLLYALDNDADATAAADESRAQDTAKKAQP